VARMTAGVNLRTQYAAVAAMRWQLLLNSLQTKRGGFELGARILSQGFFALVGLGIGLGLGFGAWQIMAHDSPRMLAALFWPVLIFWQVVPIMVTSFRENADLSIFLRFPVSFPSYALFYILFGLFDIGSLVGGIVFAVLGVRAITAEYSSGMIRLSLTATPRRERLLAAKAAVLALVTLAAGTVMTVIMFLVAQAILSGYHAPSAGLGDADALRAVLATSVMSPIVPLFALSLGFMLRSTAGAITSVLGLIFVPAIVGAILPQSWQDHVLIYLPGPASDAIAFGQLPDAPHGLSPAVAALVLAGWTAVFLGGALLALERRDA